MMKIFYIIISIVYSSSVLADAWESSPYNWENNFLNWDNSSTNWENNPNNWDNNSNNWNSNRVIRDNNGNATGYAVPKENGGTNYFNLDGIREGYLYE